MTPQPPRDPIVSGPARWRWPWDHAPEVNIGSQERTPSSSVEAPEGFRLPAFRRRSLTNPDRLHGKASGGLRGQVVSLVVWVWLFYHLAGPVMAKAAGLGLVDDPGAALVAIAAWLPEFARLAGPAASAWLWMPIAPAIAAAVLRLVAVQAASRDPVGGLWPAILAWIIELALWLFMGLKLSGEAFSAAEKGALITLLMVEGGVLIGLFFLFSSLGRKRLGKTDAQLNGD